MVQWGVLTVGVTLIALGLVRLAIPSGKSTTQPGSFPIIVGDDDARSIGSGSLLHATVFFVLGVAVIAYAVLI